MSCLAALTNTLCQEMDKHFVQILPVVLATITETQNFDPLLDSLKILRTVFKFSTPGTQYNFLKEVNKI
jgi:hypothetical protein